MKTFLKDMWEITRDNGLLFWFMYAFALFGLFVTFKG